MLAYSMRRSMEKQNKKYQFPKNKNKKGEKERERENVQALNFFITCSTQPHSLSAIFFAGHVIVARKICGTQKSPDTEQRY